MHRASGATAALPFDGGGRDLALIAWAVGSQFAFGVTPVALGGVGKMDTHETDGLEEFRIEAIKEPEGSLGVLIGQVGGET